MSVEENEHKVLMQISNLEALLSIQMCNVVKDSSFVARLTNFFFILKVYHLNTLLNIFYKGS